MKISVCSKVFVECIIYLGELKETFLFPFQSTPLAFEASSNTKKLKKASIDSF